MIWFVDILFISQTIHPFTLPLRSKLITLLNIILLLIVIFVIFRLRSILGFRNDGDEKAGRHSSGRWRHLGGGGAPSPDVEIDTSRKGKNTASEPSTLSAENALLEGKGLEVLRRCDPSFNEADFLDGARHAYVLILNAFAQGDIEKLTSLLGDSVQASFKEAITARTAAGQRLHTEIIDLATPEIEAIEVADGLARAQLCFKPQVVSALYEKNDDLVEGENNAPTRINDMWVFEREIASTNPNWRLIATEALDDTQ